MKKITLETCRLSGNPAGCDLHTWTEAIARRRYWTVRLRIRAHDFTLSVRIT